MSESLLKFTWTTYPGGFAWVEGRSQREWARQRDLFHAEEWGRFEPQVLPLGNWQVYDSDSGSSSSGKWANYEVTNPRDDWYLVADADLLDNPRGRQPYELFGDSRFLFREFAELETDKDAIRSFANVWGFLQGYSGAWIQVASKRRDIYGESFTIWKTEIQNLKRLTNLWEAIKAGKTDPIRQFIRMDSGRLNYSNESSEDYPIAVGHLFAGPGLREELLSSAEADDFAALGNRLLADFINVELRDRTATKLELYNERLETEVNPVGLIGAMYFQFAMAIANETALRRCETCGTWMGIGEGVGRREKRYCSAACQMRAYRRRKKSKVQRSDKPSASKKRQ